ncbi:MAG: DUF3368 domain-containing protein [Thermomicrobiales bacterium]
MSESPVVADASSLIALNQIDRLDILQRLWSTIVVPPAVASEIARSVDRPDWIVVIPLERAIEDDILTAVLGPGETEAIGLTRELNANRVVLDDRKARRFAQRTGLPVIGTLGALRAAKRQGILSEIRPDVEKLLQIGFHLSLEVVDRVLADVDEGH